MRKLLLLFLLLGAAAWAQPNCALTSVRCVGTAQEYATIQAARVAAVAGDTVYVKNSGSPYAGADITTVTGACGTAGNPITFLAESTAVNIDTPGNAAGDGFNVDTCNYIVINGFTVTGMSRIGIRIVLSDGSKAQNNVIVNATNQGILTGFACRVEILTNTISGTSVQHGIYISNGNCGFDGPIVRGNIVHNNAGNGIQVNGDCTTLPPSGTTIGMITGAIIEANQLYSNAAHGLMLINMSQSTVRNNLIYSNTNGTQVQLADQGCNLGSNGNVFSNNTIYTTGVGFRIVANSDDTNPTGNVFFNNLIVSDSYPCVTDFNAAVCDNTGSSATGNYFLVGLDRLTSNISGIFTNQATSDYTLASGSPAIDIGATSNQGYAAPLVDLLANGRPVAGGYDVGCYERGGTAVGPDTTPPTTPGTPAPTVTAYAVSLTWTASTDAQGVIGYIVYRNSVPYASALLNAYTDTAVVPGTLYVYDIYAYDNTPNISSNSTVTVTAYGQVGCMNADASFRSVIIPHQTGTFQFEFDSKPFGVPQSVIALAQTAPAGFSAMAVIVAFQAAGTIQARNGSSYTADITLNWSTSVSYHFRLVVRIGTHTYDVFVTPSSGGGELTLATNYAFRTDQSGATSLSYLSTNDSGGATSVCTPLLNGVAISGISYISISQQVLSTQVTSSTLTDANGSGRPLLEYPGPIILTGNYTLTPANNGALFYYAGGSSITVTVPTGLGAGFGCTAVQDSTGPIAFAGSGLTLTPAGPTHTRANGSPAVIQCTAANTCHLWGDVQ